MVNEDNNCDISGGIIIQVLPNATEKEIAYEECTNTCKNTYGSFPAVSLKDFDGTCVCQGAEEDDDELAKLDNIHNKKMSMLQSMINVKHL